MNAEPALDLTHDDSGAHRSARVGDRIRVTLQENPTTGYRWEHHVDPGVVREVDDRFEGPTSPRGAGGVRVMIFEACSPGQVELRLVERRSWETEASDEFVVHLDVER